MGRLVIVPGGGGVLRGGLRERLGECPSGAPKMPAAARLKLPGRLCPRLCGDEDCRAIIAKLDPIIGGGGAPGLGDRDRGGPEFNLCNAGAELILGEFIPSIGA
mmetsp:Transcript_127722/g.221434  ORF Transcript_127722/g.221434 Transcript_127722/m.221434 type:complete len:104 (+) Transcript_127722:126-437(+)